MSSAYEEIPAPPALRAHVDCLWWHEIGPPGPPEGRRVFPNGKVDFVWIAGLGVRIAGPQSSFLVPPEFPRAIAFGARFHPGAAPVVLRTPAASMADRHVHLSDIDARLEARLDDRMLHSGAPLATFADELYRWLRDARAPDAAIAEAVRLLDRGESVASTAERTFVSERALQRRFSEHVGYGPKTLQRVQRFQRFLTALPRVPLARAALLAGYADQPHLTREVRRLSGLTPQRLLTWEH
jgi:AraC-like DNA-binding protein